MGAHLFFSSELKSRVPVSSWLSLRRGTHREAAVGLTRRGWEPGSWRGRDRVRERGTGQIGVPCPPPTPRVYGWVNGGGG